MVKIKTTHNSTVVRGKFKFRIGKQHNTRQQGSQWKKKKKI